MVSARADPTWPQVAETATATREDDGDRQGSRQRSGSLLEGGCSIVWIALSSPQAEVDDGEGRQCSFFGGWKRAVTAGVRAAMAGEGAMAAGQVS